MITDHQYQGFMDKLVADQRGENSLNLPEWEVNFLASYQQSARPSLWFTAGRRPVVDRMWRKWGPDLGYPHPSDTINGPAPIAPADPSGCEYLVRGEDGRQSRCNEPAVWQGSRRGPRPGLRYCQMHRDHMEQRRKGSIFTEWRPL